ncbi:terpenoid cyclases/Protein prenyltransferase [Metschnikowia bicuspidata]|uniref:Terpenoid cyclases/Protein prenyltransferase n=1 Tax=Metschnikowia bicuspidata TaxID=27322 RepID=A0A4V1J2L8_9ASCO|nr:terpenoid cyclases/Protein prenyltransferase [Metschnikowia bicuspidata]
MPLLVDKHARYFRLCLASLPQSAQTEDSNKLALIYFALYGLALLNRLEPLDCQGVAEHVYSHLIGPSGGTMQAFRASGTFALDPARSDYDLPNLLATFFGLAILALLEEDFSAKIDRHKIMRFVARCHVTAGSDCGSFRPVLDAFGEPFGESDLRLCYLAACIRTLVGYDKFVSADRLFDIDIAALVAFVVDKVAVTGGMASAAYAEPHSGLTFCGVAALSLLNPETIFAAEPANTAWKDATVDWLVHRQYDVSSLQPDDEHDPANVGGFNGRPNKLQDTCYSWWVMALMRLLRGAEPPLFDVPRATDYLLHSTQHAIMGGFGKHPRAFPDPLHSFLGIASLALVKQSSSVEFDGMDALAEIDPELVITRKLRDFVDRLWLS